ncbi:MULTISPECIES: MarR family winged helix-turn-helix transcriptional regulator [unclassified Butyrivibrio]|uniref:MarR family winged helix-turn-helix transcriptional regulator n=1 Tax=unclassified Butyrivibrio TaxID=2639466 RepID=UPI0003B394A8|nr:MULTISPECIES: MarR family transcriptional regulator [unclassified Butyrivibrio]
MKDYKELAWLMERIIHKYNQFEKKPQVYCKDIILTQPEIHTIAIVGDYEGIGITQLAKMRGITKGAASQMIYKLVDKGLVEKRVSPDSDAAVSLYLTKKGKKARSEHRKLHENMGTMYEKMLDQIPEETLESMKQFLKAFDEALDKM